MGRRGLVLLALTVAAATVGVAAAWAGFPNILRWGEATLVDGSGVSAPVLAASTAAGSGALADPRVLVEDVVVVGIKEGVVVTLTAQFEAVYVCVDAGGGVPNPHAGLKLAGDHGTSAQFAAAKNGKATGSLLTGPLPSAAEAAARRRFACPRGQTLEFDRVVFFDLVLSADGGERVELDEVLASDSVHGLS